jgi:hypothetical protein
LDELDELLCRMERHGWKVPNDLRGLSDDAQRRQRDIWQRQRKTRRQVQPKLEARIRELHLDVADSRPLELWQLHPDPDQPERPNVEACLLGDTAAREAAAGGVARWPTSGYDDQVWGPIEAELLDALARYELSFARQTEA